LSTENVVLDACYIRRRRIRNENIGDSVRVTLTVEKMVETRLI